MIQAIKDHNQLNGTRFSTIEFLVVFFAALLIAAGYLRQGNALGAILAGGIAMNSLWIVGFGLRSWSRREMGAGIGRLFNKEYRQRMSREHPNLSRQMALITVSSLIPFAMTVLILAELIGFRR